MKKNSKEYESLLTKLKKLMALADKGVAGEAKNARHLLEKLCNQYDINIEELLDIDTKHSYTFEIGKAKDMMQLFFLCLDKVADIEGMKYIQPTRSSICIEVTAMQRAELLSLFNWHKANYLHELEEIKENFMSAYIDKHNLYYKHIEKTNNSSIEELADEDIARIRRVLAMRESMTDNYYHKQLESIKQ